MRTHDINLTSSLRGWCTGLATAGLVLAVNPSSLAQTLPASPVGTWDFVVSGSQQGIAFLTFDKDFSVTGYEILCKKLHPASTSTDLRNPNGSDTGRGGGILNINQTTGTNLFLYGLVSVSGSWGFDLQGRTIGFFTEPTVDTNVTPSLSFLATVRPGKRMTLRTTDSPNPGLTGTIPRKSVYSGVPLATAPDLTGSWLGTGGITDTTDGSSQQFSEFFTLTGEGVVAETDPALLNSVPLLSQVTGPATANMYVLTGSGPGYTSLGVAFSSVQKRIAIASLNASPTATNDFRRASMGAFNVNRSIGNLIGDAEISSDQTVGALRLKAARTSQ